LNEATKDWIGIGFFPNRIGSEWDWGRILIHSTGAFVFHATHVAAGAGAELSRLKWCAHTWSDGSGTALDDGLHAARAVEP
jgi:hypothetical protein